MANVTIDSGPVDADDALREVPQGKWFELMQVRRGFLRIYLPRDCRRLLEFVEDAEQMYGPLGFKSADDFIRRGLELDPEQVTWAVEGLRKMRPDEPIPFAKAIALGKPGRPKKGEEKGCNATLNRGTAAHWLARLDRDEHTELAAQVRAGALSANAAAIEAGYRKQKTALDRLRKDWKEATEEERRAFLKEISP